MTNKEINDAVFRSLGWSIVEDSPYKGCNWNRGAAYTAKPPNYAESLDACAEFERTLDRIQRREYVRQLYDITENDFGAHCATPAQRCEAFLRVKGKWRDGK